MVSKKFLYLRLLLVREAIFCCLFLCLRDARISAVFFLSLEKDSNHPWRFPTESAWALVSAVSSGRIFLASCRFPPFSSESVSTEDGEIVRRVTKFRSRRSEWSSYFPRASDAPKSRPPVESPAEVRMQLLSPFVKGFWLKALSESTNPPVSSSACRLQWSPASFTRLSR